MFCVLFLIGMQTSTEVFAAEEGLPVFDAPLLPNNYEASDSMMGCLNGFPESSWNFGVPDSQRPGFSSQSQGNDLYYAYGLGDSQNASSSFQNDSKKSSHEKLSIVNYIFFIALVIFMHL